MRKTRDHIQTHPINILCKVVSQPIIPNQSSWTEDEYLSSLAQTAPEERELLSLCAVCSPQLTQVQWTGS